MRKIAISFMLTSLFLLSACFKLDPPPMPHYTPTPFTELNGKCFAVLSERKIEGPGAYMILFDLNTLETVRNIPIPEVNGGHDFSVFYWNNKYYFQQSGYNNGKLSQSVVGVIDSTTGSLTKVIPFNMPGEVSGVTLDGKMYVLTNLRSDLGMSITAIDTKIDEVAKEVHLDTIGPFSYLSPAFIYNAVNYSYFVGDIFYNTRLYRINTQTDQPEVIYTFSEPLNDISGTVDSDSKYLYMSIGPGFREYKDGSSPYDTNRIMVFDLESNNLTKEIDLPDAKWYMEKKQRRVIGCQPGSRNIKITCTFKSIQLA